MGGIVIFGAGAIGGLMAARLEAAGTPVTVVVRGAHAAAIAANGLRLISEGTETVTHPRIAAPGSAEPADTLILTLKAPSIAPALPAITPLIGPETTIVAAVNGIPWWYGYGLEGPFRDRRVRSVDPDGVLWEALPPRQTIGCVLYPAAEVPEPGVVLHTHGDRFSLGEPDGSRSERAAALSQLLVAAGLKAPVKPRIRDEIWLKLWGNLAFNPLSALTAGHLDELAGDPGTRAVARAMMVEAQAVAERLGIRFPIGVDRRIEAAGEVGHHKTSMRQDYELGRPLEVEALVGAVAELAGWVEVPVPTIGIVLAMVRLAGRLRLGG